MIEKTLFAIQRIIFRKVGPKFPPGFLKGLMDKIFDIFEKIVINFQFI